MNVFDMIGPIMIGPSSSHTAGAVRLGRVAWKLLGELPVRAEIELAGSFAQTYRGHGTDKALLAGIMGFDSSDDRIRHSLDLATVQGIQYHFSCISLPDAHPNTARIHLYTAAGTSCSIEGASIGGGNILITEINGMQVSFTGQFNTILVQHYDRPGAIASAANLIAESDINIAGFRLSRKEKGGEALMMIEVEGDISESCLSSLRSLPNIIKVILIQAI